MMLTLFGLSLVIPNALTLLTLVLDVVLIKSGADSIVAHRPKPRHGHVSTVEALTYIDLPQNVLDLTLQGGKLKSFLFHVRMLGCETRHQLIQLDLNSHLP